MDIGIITIHKINNYGSVLQAYALQETCEKMGYRTEIIDYSFPNDWHNNNKYSTPSDKQPTEPKWIKVLFFHALLRQHVGIANFVKKYQHLSRQSYQSPQLLKEKPPHYDTYITGSDQVWNPRHCKGDPTFMLHFAPDKALKISYAASIGTRTIPEQLAPVYKELLSKYDYISVREFSGAGVVEALTRKKAKVVVDPTLLLSSEDWNTIALKKRVIKKKYILCYFLNYTFNAFPYVDELAAHIQKLTGYEIVRVARPPHKLSFAHTHYSIGASPEKFLSLVRDAEVVLTTSFHGTAFAVNYGKPVLTIVKDKEGGDSRQLDLMQQIGLERQVMAVGDSFPENDSWSYDVEKAQSRLSVMREDSFEFLKNAIGDE